MKQLTWADSIFPVLDFETTGVNVETDYVVQAALVFEAPGGYVLPSSIIEYVNPGEVALQCLSAGAIGTHGITPELATSQGVPSEELFMKLYMAICGIHHLGLPLVGYNIPFDWRILHYELRRYGYPDPPCVPLLDVMLLDQKFDKYRKGSRKLGSVAEFYGVELNDAHAAYADCVATAEVLRKLLNRYHHLKEYKLQELHELQTRWFETLRADRNRYWASIGKDARIDHNWPGI